MCKLIIAGSRTINDKVHIFGLLDELCSNVTEVICGMAKGPDLFGKEWAESRNIPVKEFPAHWEQWPHKAGFMRNLVMADYADELIAFWDGKSPGTRHMVQCMVSRKKPFQVILIRD